MTKFLKMDPFHLIGKEPREILPKNNLQIMEWDPSTKKLGKPIDNLKNIMKDAFIEIQAKTRNTTMTLRKTLLWRASRW